MRILLSKKVGREASYLDRWSGPLCSPRGKGEIPKRYLTTPQIPKSEDIVVRVVLPNGDDVQSRSSDALYVSREEPKTACSGRLCELKSRH